MANGVKYEYQYRVTPTVLTSLYTTNRQLCAPLSLAGIVRGPNMTVNIKSITVIDLGGANPALDFIFFKKDVAISNGANQTCNVSQADMREHCTLIERVGAAQYTASAFGTSESIATVHPNNLTVNADAAGIIKVAVMTRTAITPATAAQYTIVMDLEIL